MEKLWKGRQSGGLSAVAEELNRSIGTDGRMWRQDIRGSRAHARMLASCGILSAEDAAAIESGLTAIEAEIADGTIAIDPTAEDIHTFIEGELTRRVGDAGRRLHTARSRNDQVATDLRLYLRDTAAETAQLLRALLAVLCDKAETVTDAVLPGYTHMQRAQPVTYAHMLCAYGMMFRRDLSRLSDAVSRMNESPLGCCALAGTTYPIDRTQTAADLGFDGICENSLDGVSDRDFCCELASALSLMMVHLSRFSEEIILYCSWEFGFLKLDDSYTTGSSIMPQKKNPDIAELVRGKTGRVFGDLTTLLTMLKGLPLAYNKDMQEDKDAIFDAFDTVNGCLSVFAPMVAGLTVNRERMHAAAMGGYLNATDLADYLTRKGMPFRTAYRISGELVADCVARGVALDALPLDVLQAHSPLFEADVYDAIALAVCVGRRTSAGGPAEEEVRRQIAILRKAGEASL